MATHGGNPTLTKQGREPLHRHINTQHIRRTAETTPAKFERHVGNSLLRWEGMEGKGRTRSHKDHAWHTVRLCSLLMSEVFAVQRVCRVVGLNLRENKEYQQKLHTLTTEISAIINVLCPVCLLLSHIRTPCGAWKATEAAYNMCLNK